jgi:cytoskeletal protein RodZ
MARVSDVVRPSEPAVEARIMLGEELKRRREDLGLTLAQISEATRIGTRFLRAIETDDFAVLPEGIYTRSFIRAYAKHVRMDEDQAMRLYQEQTGASTTLAEPVEPIVEEKPFVYKEPASGFWPAAAVAAALALVLSTGAWALFHYMQKSGGAAEVASSPPVQTSVVEPPRAEAPVQPISDNDGLKITLQASDACWIKYVADDGKPTQKQLAGGEIEQIQANESVDLSIGNTRVISMQINGRDAHFPADTGVVLKKLTITPESAQTLVN